MKYIFEHLIIYFSFACLSLAHSPLDIQGEIVDELEWSETRRLTWEDFKGKQPSQTDKNLAAVTSCGFGFKARARFPFSKPKLEVRNIFFPGSSWVNNLEKHRPELIEHEQVHFDISEVYARQLRKEFQTSQIHYFNLKKRAEEIFQKVHSSYLRRQELYERETEFSLNKKKQATWKITIQNELNALSNYAKN